jgi:hypothetical protein
MIPRSNLEYYQITCGLIPRLSSPPLSRCSASVPGSAPNRSGFSTGPVHNLEADLVAVTLQ